MRALLVLAALAALGLTGLTSCASRRAPLYERVVHERCVPRDCTGPVYRVPPY